MRWGSTFDFVPFAANELVEGSEGNRVSTTDLDQRRPSGLRENKGQGASISILRQLAEFLDYKFYDWCPVQRLC